MAQLSPPATQVSSRAAQAKPSTLMVPRLIAGGLIGAVAGVIIMMVAHSKGERERNITELASTLEAYRVQADVTAATIWGYAGFGLLVLGVLTAIVGLVIIAATKHEPS